MTKKTSRRIKRRERKTMNWIERDKQERGKRRELRRKKEYQRNTIKMRDT